MARTKEAVKSGKPSKKSPLKAKKSPLKTKKSPLKTKKSPLKTKKSPLKTKKSSLKSKKSSLKSEESDFKKGKSKADGFSIYIWQVLKQVHPGMKITTASMSIMNSIMNDLFERIANEASNLSKIRKMKTIGIRELRSACRLVMPGELGSHANGEGTKAVAKYSSK